MVKVQMKPTNIVWSITKWWRLKWHRLLLYDQVALGMMRSSSCNIRMMPSQVIPGGMMMFTQPRPQDSMLGQAPRLMIQQMQTPGAVTRSSTPGYQKYWDVLAPVISLDRSLDTSQPHDVCDLMFVFKYFPIELLQRTVLLDCVRLSNLDEGNIASITGIFSF